MTTIRLVYQETVTYTKDIVVPDNLDLASLEVQDQLDDRIYTEIVDHIHYTPGVSIVAEVSDSDRYFEVIP